MRDLRVPAFHQSIPSAAFGWSLEDIMSARDEQIAGRFRRPVQLAVAMRTNPDLFTAWKVRVAPLAALAVSLEPAMSPGAKGPSPASQRVAREGEILFGEPGPSRGTAISRGTIKTINGDLANHAIAIGYNTWTARPDGSRHDVVHRPWPLEFVWYREWEDQLYTSVDAMTSQEDRDALAGDLSERAKRQGKTVDLTSIPITHADGRWTVYRSSDLLPWRHDAALLPGALTWASAAYSSRDWNRGSNSHGNSKIIGRLPEQQPLQVPVLDDAGAPTGEATTSPEALAMLALLEDMASLDMPYGLAQFGSEIEILSNPSRMWEIWKELGLSAAKSAQRIYNGTDGALGATGGAPGVDIAKLFDVASTVIQGDKAAIERGIHEGVIEPWAAINQGDSSLAPQRRYLMPDPDEQQKREHQAANEDAFTTAYQARKSAGILTQPWADEYADRLGVPQVTVPAEAAAQESSVELAPTDIAVVVKVDEARRSQGLTPLENTDEGSLMVAEFKALKEAKGSVEGEAEGEAAADVGPASEVRPTGT